MDFFDRQERARRHTRWLIGYFGLSVVAIVAVTYVLFAPGVLIFLKPPPHAHRMPVPLAVFWLLGEALTHPGHFIAWTWEPRLAAAYALGASLVIGLGSLYKIRQLAAGGSVVAELLGGRRVEPDTADAEEQRLRHVVEEMALASGVGVPEIYVLDHERGINSFAAGHTRDDVAIGVTRGGLKLLDRDELQGVMAHEFSHILNGDTRLNLRLMGLVHGVLLPVIAGRILLRGADRPADPGESALAGIDTWPRVPAVLAGGVLLVIGSIGLPFARLIKSAICREREWLADAAAVQFTRYPAGISGALKKIGGLLKQGRLDTPQAETASHLYFTTSSRPPWFGFLATHPPLLRRLLAIDPDFDGQVPKVASLRPTQVERDRMYENALGAIMAVHQARPDLLLGTAGEPTVEHLRQAAAIRLGLPPAVAAACHSTAGAQAVVYALLVAANEETQAGELEALRQRVDPEMFEQVTGLLAEVRELAPGSRLPVLDLSLPALRRLEAAQYGSFAQRVQELIEYDRAIDLFEYALVRVLRHRLQGYYTPTAGFPPACRSVGELVPECCVLLSALAYVGQEESAQAAAFARGARELDLPAAGGGAGMPALRMPPREERDLAHVDAALDRLAQASPSVKRNVLRACAQTVAADGQVRYREAELLRAIAAALDCPLPPFLEALAASAAAADR
jgi:Zn-dependent protease with chaperone function